MPTVDKTKCIHFGGWIDAKGYGRMYFQGKYWRAHRVAWIKKNGSIPDGLFVLHKCDTPSCVNPDHLFLGTHADNMRDMVEKGRQAAPHPGPGSGPGEANGMSKLTDISVRKIRLLSMFGFTQRRLASEFSVSQPVINRVIQRKGWVHI